jgi:hypothetical protein
VSVGIPLRITPEHSGPGLVIAEARTESLGTLPIVHTIHITKAGEMMIQTTLSSALDTRGVDALQCHIGVYGAALQELLFTT